MNDLLTLFSFTISFIFFRCFRTTLLLIWFMYNYHLSTIYCRRKRNGTQTASNRVEADWIWFVVAGGWTDAHIKCMLLPSFIVDSIRTRMFVWRCLTRKCPRRFRIVEFKRFRCRRCAQIWIIIFCANWHKIKFCVRKRRTAALRCYLINLILSRECTMSAEEKTIEKCRYWTTELFIVDFETFFDVLDSQCAVCRSSFCSSWIAYDVMFVALLSTSALKCDRSNVLRLLDDYWARNENCINQSVTLSAQPIRNRKASSNAPGIYLSAFGTLQNRNV